MTCLEDQVEQGERILAIQNQLVTGSLEASNRDLLVTEQRRLWDEAYPGRAFEEIARDVWLVRSYGSAPARVDGSPSR